MSTVKPDKGKKPDELTAEEWLWLYENRCAEHGHRFISHMNCYMQEEQVPQRVAGVDIEASGLDADFAVMLCWCVKPVGEKIISDVLTLEDIDRGKQDERIVESLVDELVKYDRIFTHYGTYFDVPFIRTRALVHKLYFPGYGALYHTDVWMMAKKKLKIHSNRQDSVSQTLTNKSDKTKIHPDIWLKAQFGTKKERKEALKYIQEHCRIDVEELEENYLALLPYVHQTNTSI